MLRDLFKKTQYATVQQNVPGGVEKVTKPNIPNGMWKKCAKCNTLLYTEDLERNHNVCTNCNYHFRISAKERIEITFDKDTFKEYKVETNKNNPINFTGYEEKLRSSMESAGVDEAVVVGVGKINGYKVCAAIMDSHFMMGSMGTVVGERITSLIEYSTAKRLPIVIFTASGGARMHEGIFSLMQMAKISAAIGKHDEAGLLYITIITNPTTGGVTASFAMEGDIIISEPGAILGFAGRRVIENTIREKLPDYFQSSEFALEKGFVDEIVDRKNIKLYLSKALKLHGVNYYE